MEMKHTPGPWIAWDDNRTIGIVDAQGEPLAVAEVVDYGDQAEESQLLADQGLIATAPDLLKAARGAKIVIDEMFRNYIATLGGEYYRMIADLDAAIAQATGHPFDRDCPTCEGCGVVVMEGGNHIECPKCEGECRIYSPGKV